MIFADGFEDAFVGVALHKGVEIGVYDAEMCVDTLVARDGMSRADAIEYFEFNVVGAYAGPGTPLFLTRMDHDTAREMLELEAEA
jgi:hypothetical protein